ncbi:MAG: GIY-YIG nuclease family protein [Candidatus Moranbacteria bacterium]|nr:GIY-YIG nuclease family protein [Candidatus Moranbacteria bacterium]
MTYYVYILKCSDQTLYTGITTDPKRRIHEHNNSNKLGAKYTRPRRPVKLVYTKKYKTRSEATKEEIRIKKLSRESKKLLITKNTF